MPFEPEIRAAAAKHNIPYDLLYAQVRQESAFDNMAASRCGARGLLQLMPATGEECGLRTAADFFDAQKNLFAGALYLRRMYKSAKSMVISLPKIYKGKPTVNECTEDDYWKLALAGYNGGLGYMIKAINICLMDGHPVKWETVSAHLSDKREVVHGHDPDEKQIIDYVTKIWANYKEATA